MLHTQAVDPPLLGLLTELMKGPAFQNFILVGGTALALQLGHRKSVDIDLFGDKDINEAEITLALQSIGNTTTLSRSKRILVYTVNGIKVDFVGYSYPWIEEPSVHSGIRLASKQDIAAMKLNAIVGRGSKKDFIDLCFLLNTFSLKEMVQFYLTKYHDGSEFLVIKSLNYFDDADMEDMPVMLATSTWEKIKRRISQEVNTYLGLKK